MSDDGVQLQTPVEILDQTWYSMEEARLEVIQSDGQCAEDLHAYLETQVQAMYYQLRHKAALVQDTWEKYHLDQIPALCARQVGTSDPSVVDFGVKTGGGEPVIERAPVDTLLLWVEGFRECLQELQLDISGPPQSGGGRLRTADIHNARFGQLGDFADTHFARALIEDVEGARDGGAIIIVDAEDARTGIGKTSAAVAFAKFAANLFGYELQERDLVLSGQQYLKLYEEQPGEEQVSVAVWDEAVGAGSGDARRAMAQENVDLGKAWQVMRQQKVLTFVTLPDWGDLDSRLQKLADYRLWCRRDIGEAQAYEIGTEFGSGGIRTRGLGPGDGAEPISFPDMKTLEDPHYMALKEKKTELIESGTLDADSLHEEAEERTPEDNGPDLMEIADTVADNIDDYTSVHSGNGTTYLDRDLIEVRHDLSRRDAKKVKSLVEKEGVEI